MSLSYVRSDSVGRKIIPAPLVTLNKDYNRNPDGSKVGTVYNITLRGTLLPFRGSPSGAYASLDTAFHSGTGYPSDEVFASNNEDFDNILRKQEALRWLFSEDGGSLEWQPSGGQPVVKCNPRVVSVEFDEGTWADRCNYTVTLEANWIFINGTSDLEDALSQDLIESSDESWSFEEIEGREGQQFNVSHTVRAKGILGYNTFAVVFENKQAWEHARDYVNARVSGSIDSSIMLAALGDNTKFFGNYVKVVNVDKTQGSYEITERWLLSDEVTYTEQQFNVDFNSSTGESEVTYQGTINGISQGERSGDQDNVLTSRAAIPSDAAARIIANTYVGVLLNGKSIPVSPNTRSIVLNKQTGTANFTFKWTTSDTLTTTIGEEVQYTISTDNQLHSINFTQSIEPYGSDSATKVTNAKAALYTNTAAYNRSISLLSNVLEVPAANINTTPRNKVTSINSKSGSTRASWTFTNRDTHNTEVDIQIQNPNVVIASIPIPGRTEGPIIQNMETVTSRITTVSIRANNYFAQPSLDTTVYADGIIISDSETWNPQTGVATRSTRFLEET
jgi:hypothetical protein